MIVETSDNKRIAQNSLFLFIRMSVLLAVNLYTSRVILAALGVSDYGIYNVVGGIVTMFAFINNAMVNSTQRYVTYELGKHDFLYLNRVFSTSFIIHVIISAIIVLLSETGGLWFLYNKMVIPTERMVAAFWVLQLSVLTCVVNIMSVPYNALIIAHERMSAFAWISLVDAGLKLLIAYLITMFAGDRLVFFALLTAMVAILDRVIYLKYCRREFPESCYHKVFDKPLINEMLKFAFWNLLGNFAYACYTQGLNILLNVFFNPIVNASRSIAVQIQSATSNFSYNIENAIKPQITKSYAHNDFNRMHTLISISARMSFYALLLITLPIFWEINQVLNLWLKEVPEHTANFARLTIVILWFEALANPLLTASQATGDMKKYQFTVSLLSFSILPLSYCALLIYPIPEVVYMVSLCIGAIVQFVKLGIVSKQIGLSVRQYLKDVFARTIIVTVLSNLIVLVLYSSLEENLVRLLLVCILSCSVTIFFVMLIGIRNEERDYVKIKARWIIKRKLGL